MQGLPPFVTMRVDDDLGPFDWVHLANEVGLKPWVGYNIGDIDPTEAADLSALVNSGNATAIVHGGPSISFIYAPSPAEGDLPQATWQSNFDWCTQFMQQYNIPSSKFLLPQYYRFGTNNFSGTADIASWGVEFLGTIQDPGAGYGAPWLLLGPFDTYGVRTGNIFYADFMNIRRNVPGHPETEAYYFDCMTEIRDDNGYEWYPTVGSPEAVASTITHGTAQLKRALDAMALPTLFTHGFSSIDAPALSSPPKPKDPSSRPSTNHLNPTGTSISRRPKRRATRSIKLLETTVFPTPASARQPGRFPNRYEIAAHR
jgi:hypothetical protein